MAVLEALTRELLAVEVDGPRLVTVSIDLRAAALGVPPAGPNAVRQALNEEWSRLGLSSQADVRSFAEDQARIESVIEEAVAEGAQGVFFCGCAGDEIEYHVAMPSPFRNSARIGQRPWLFELERVAYLFGQPITVVFVDLHTIDMVRVRYGEGAETAGVDHEKHWISKRAGRTNISGRSGAVAAGAMGSGSGPMGGHSKNRVDHHVEERRRAFAREAAAELEGFLESDEPYLLAGVGEARSQLLAQLDPRVAERALEVPAALPGADPRERSREAMLLSRDQQILRADAAAEEWLSGAVGEQLAAGRASVSRALDDGRLGELVIHEESVRHLGVAEDTRAQGGIGDEAADEVLGVILRRALETDVTVRFGQAPVLLSDHEGVVGRTRW